jgi:NAD(P)-dependent dehydrogenase (short-subunit alcohol dehydrogenase family)
MTADYITDLFSVRGKVVLVTGGSRGIGRSIAEGFVRAGARVYINSRSTEACGKAAAELSAYGRCTALPASLDGPDSCAGLAESLSVREDSLDVLVNNAGTIWAAPLQDYPEAGWDKVFNLNVKSVFYLIGALTPLLSAGASLGDPARIINIGSIDGLHVPAHETYAYSASKAAVHQLSRHLADQLASSHITVNVIAPGMFESKMLAATLAQRGPEAMLAHTPLKRFASPRDMAGAAIFLASAAGAYLTGTVLPVDGGTTTTL